ncbi:MAG TPA: sulfite exporter TauE/SafE family protein, partial [Nakamurella sp.]
LAGFAVLMLAVAALMLTRRRGRVPVGGCPGVADSVPLDVPIITFSPRFVCACPRAAKVHIAAVAVGLMTGFFGVGGGFLVVPALVLALDFAMPVAVGTSLLVIAINSATSLVARAGHGIDIDWTIVGVFTAAAVIGGLLGARIATRARPETLRIAFAVLIIAVGLYTASRSIAALLG